MYELGKLGLQIDDPFVSQPSDEVRPRNEERLVARLPRKSQHREQDALDLQRVVMRRLPAPELELTQFLHPVCTDDGEVDPAADTHPSSR